MDTVNTVNTVNTIVPRKRNRLIKRIIANRWYYLFLAPTIIFLAIFHYGPMYGVQIAFRNFNPALGIWGSPWVGLHHFKEFINGYYFWPILKNTLSVSICSTLFGFPMPIFIALLLNELKSKRYKKIVQTTLYAPHFISTVVLVGMVIIMLSPSTGIINKALEFLGFEKQYFMIQPESFLYITVISGIWQGMGWSAIIYLAALSGVDPQLHEAATIDGASRLQRIWHINFPAIKPTIVILLIMSIGRIASVGFEKVFLLQTPLNLETSEVISTYVYKRGLLNASYSFSAAVSFFNNIVNITLLLLANFTARKFSETSLF
jgi:putative aldouronate transport system permease protein